MRRRFFIWGAFLEQILDAGYLILDVGFWMLVSGIRYPAQVGTHQILPVTSVYQADPLMEQS
jgi:hypothetical protein